MVWTRDPRSLEERFWSRVRITDGCWLWLNVDGTVVDRYGRLRVTDDVNGRREVLMHKFSWELHNGRPTSAGMQILHHCDVKPCVRPDHLYEGTEQDNNRDRVIRKRSPKARQTHCLRGHPFDEQNTYLFKNGTRHCKQCRWLAKHPDLRDAFDRQQEGA